MIEELPVYIYCDVEGCDLKHFLSLNRDIQGKWSIGYVAYSRDGELGVSCSNGFESIEEASKWIKEQL